jgi:hypothetical protein
MTDFFTREPDPLEELLAPPPAAGAEGLRERLLGRTTRLLRRRRRLRRLAGAAALAGCCAAGLLAVWWAARPAPAPPELVVPALAGDPSEQHRLKAELPTEAVAVEERAADDDDPRAQASLYRRAGDLYLSEENDPAAAVRCYGNALDAGGEADLSVVPSDNWLLMAIKNARQKEKRHANNGG